MPATIATHNLYPFHPKRPICMSCHGAWNGIEERRPSATGLEFVVGGVERCVAAGAVVGAVGWVVFVEFAGEGGLGAFLAEDLELF